VHHPECALVTQRKIIVYYPDDDREVHCELVQINVVEALQAS
jgi:hypothetical protein